MIVILASASPRRKDLLDAAGIPCEVQRVDVDERLQEGEAGRAYVERVAALKADRAAELSPGRVVLAADTAVVAGGRILGKPRDAADAVRMLLILSGHAHEVLTGVAIRSPGGQVTFTESTTVWFAPLTAADIRWYVASGEPLDKAGAYAIQGLASRFVTRIEGSYTNVVGLPVAEVASALVRLGHRDAVRP